MSPAPATKPRLKWPWIVAGFAVCFFFGGAFLWKGTYDDYLHAGFHWEIIPVQMAVALLSTWSMGLGIVVATVTVGMAFPAAIMARVVIDCLDDPSHHNLWPFELVLAVAFGIVMSFSGAASGRLLRWATHRNRA